MIFESDLCCKRRWPKTSKVITSVVLTFVESSIYHLQACKQGYNSMHSNSVLSVFYECTDRKCRKIGQIWSVFTRFNDIFIFPTRFTVKQRTLELGDPDFPVLHLRLLLELISMKAILGLCQAFPSNTPFFFYIEWLIKERKITWK